MVDSCGYERKESIISIWAMWWNLMRKEKKRSISERQWEENGPMKERKCIKLYVTYEKIWKWQNKWRMKWRKKMNILRENISLEEKKKIYESYIISCKNGKYIKLVKCENEIYHNGGNENARKWK